MGVDFLMRTGRGFSRSCQKGYEDLKRTQLFDPSVDVKHRTFLAKMKEGTAHQSTEVVLRVEGAGIGIYCDELKIGDGENPPEAIFEKVRAAEEGLAVGRIEHVHPFSGTADIAVQ